MAAALALLTASCSSSPSSSSETAASADETQTSTGARQRPASADTLSLEQALAARESIRSYRPDALSEALLLELGWAAQGITHRRRDIDRRAAPSAGATYPLELYLATERGVRHYRPQRGAFVPHLDGDRRAAIERAAFDQEFISEAPAVFIIAGIYARTEQRYGERAIRYVHIEVGHAAENLLLMATSRKLAAVAVGGFDDDELAHAIALPDGETPLLVIPVGHPGPTAAVPSP